MSGIVIVIEDVRGSVTASELSEHAEALASRLGGICTVAYPLIPHSEAPTVWQLLCGAMARIKTNAAMRRVTQE